MSTPIQTNLAALLLALTLPSCGGAVGEAIRPTDHTASGALGANALTCAGEPKYAKPLIVDLDPDARVELEATMKKGVAVIAYDCSSFRVLSSCKLQDSVYEYAGVQRKEQLVQMNSMDDLHANMPISSAKVGAELQSGRSINVALMLVGLRSTTLAKVSKEDLVGSCDGATHFVQAAAVGAFSIATGSVGKAAVVAEIFNYGGGAKSESDRKAMNKDGSLDECLKSEPDSEVPPAECRTPVRVTLLPIAGVIATAAATKGGKGGKEEADKASSSAENPCPTGFLFVDGACARNSGQAHLCDPDNETECKTQCDKGNAESCHNYSLIVRKAKSPEAAMPFQKKACDGGFADGCAELGVSMLPDSDDSDVQNQAKAALAVLKKGCEMGSGRGCDMAGDTMMDKDYKVRDVAAAVKIYDRGCDLGTAFSCWSLAQLYFKGVDVPKDVDKGIGLLSKACQGGNADECSELGDVYAKGKYGSVKDTDKAYRAQKRACELDAGWCSNAAAAAIVVGKEKTAFALAERGCNLNDDESCIVVGDYYKAGTGTSVDEDKAKAVWAKACVNGDGDPDACKRIGVKMKD